MKPWKIVFCVLLLAACKNDPKEKVPGTLPQEDMPAPVQNLLSKLEQNPDSSSLRMRLVDALDSLGAYKQALQQLDLLIKKDSLNYGLWYRKALLQENTRDTTGALRSYRYAIRIYPSPDAMLAAANLLAEKKDTTALQICQELMASGMGREYAAHCYFITGVYYARAGNHTKAIESFNSCIRNDLNYMEAYMEKGFLYFDNHQTREALQVFQTVVTIKNTYADGYYWIAKCKEILKQPAEAIDNYRKSLTLDPKLAEAAAALNRLGVK
jgi:tetratricopeptide (TPR) repeat protein